MSLLNPTRLRGEVEARESRKIKVFEHILDTCYNKIMTTNQQTGDCCCIFTCPSVVFGLPLFNLIDCIRFIMVKLVEKGFEVHLAIPNNIFISWKKESNPDYSRQLYQLEAPARSSSSSNHNSNSNSNHNSISRGNKLAAIMPTSGHREGDYKLFSSRPGTKKEKDKNYRPIEDYRHNGLSNSIGHGTDSRGYTLDDIDLFHNKLDELLA